MLLACVMPIIMNIKCSAYIPLGISFPSRWQLSPTQCTHNMDFSSELDFGSCLMQRLFEKKNVMVKNVCNAHNTKTIDVPASTPVGIYRLKIYSLASNALQIIPFSCTWLTYMYFFEQ